MFKNKFQYIFLACLAIPFNAVCTRAEDVATSNISPSSSSVISSTKIGIIFLEETGKIPQIKTIIEESQSFRKDLSKKAEKLEKEYQEKFASLSSKGGIIPTKEFEDRKRKLEQSFAKDKEKIIKEGHDTELSYQKRFAEMQKLIQDAIIKISQSKNLEFVLSSQAILCVNPKSTSVVDITLEVMDHVKQSETTPSQSVQK